MVPPGLLLVDRLLLSLLASVLSADEPFMSEPMLGIVLACEVPSALAGFISAPSCLGGNGDGDLDVVAFWFCSCAKGDGAMSRGSIFDVGGVEEELRV